MIYAFIDSNIFIRVMSQGKPGCEAHLFDDLRTLAEGNAIALIIPEVVLFELERQMQDLDKLVRQHFGKMKEAVNKTTVWSEVADAKLSVLSNLDIARNEKIESWNKTYSDIMTFLNSDYVKQIPYTPEIMCQAKSRIIRGAMPKSTGNQDQDAAIVESLAAFFAKCGDKDAVLLFCSENHTDFAIEVTKTGSRDRRFALHPLIASSLPITHYFFQLSDLLKIDRGYESLPKPIPDDEISEAISEIRKFEEDYDIDSDDYQIALVRLDRLYNERLSQGFAEHVLPELPDELREKRQKALDNIQHLLMECRHCESWDEDRSESKLPQWLENVPEEMIKYTSLANLLKIEKNLVRYLSIHEAMDDDLADR
jgi:hypothetical protein